ncbi:GNAT family N-acetyltransferase [Liquorilactobacillus hordei]|uniref:GNAT family N-acetyltransferase n=1 Tax=Liquorilactobacillus hordei TaxID=468911 RepID=UPI001CBEE7AC|nr:GNAT family N-acetyltransferase [Liquorilactobacillus hordei]MBZ2405018.1 GNAT family N-acetyltransferase [Liquorilactobacillus hordei]
MVTNLITVTNNDIDTLRQISIETFSDTFGAENSKEDLEKYLESAYDSQKLEKEVENPESNFQFIYYQNQLAGYLKLNIGSAQSELQSDDALEVERIYIKKEFKRLGLGKQLISYAIDEAKKAHKKYIWLGVWEHNEGAIVFYQKQGFVEFSEHIFDLGGDEQRDILMKKSLI